MGGLWANDELNNTILTLWDFAVFSFSFLCTVIDSTYDQWLEQAASAQPQPYYRTQSSGNEIIEPKIQ